MPNDIRAVTSSYYNNLLFGNGVQNRCNDKQIPANYHGTTCQICRWLRQHRSEGCSWNAFDGAAAGGHMHVLDWLDGYYRNIGPSAVAFVKVCVGRKSASIAAKTEQNTHKNVNSCTLIVVSNNTCETAKRYVR